MNTESRLGQEVLACPVNSGHHMELASHWYHLLHDFENMPEFMFLCVFFLPA